MANLGLAKNRNADKWLIEEDWDRDRILNKLLIPALEGITRMGGFRSKGSAKWSNRYETRCKVINRSGNSSTATVSSAQLHSFHL